MKSKYLYSILLGLSFFAYANNEAPRPDKVEVVHELHSDKRVDPYFWLKERENPKVLEHLKAENVYTDKILSPVLKLSEDLYSELKGRVKEDDSNYPYREGAYYYYYKYFPKKEYPVYYRAENREYKNEEIIWDVNERSKGFEYFKSRIVDINPSKDLMLVATDTVGRNFYSLSLWDLKTRSQILPEIKDVTNNGLISEDGKFLYYVVQDKETLRDYKVVKHSVASNTGETIYEEKDDTFSVGVSRFKTRSQVLVSSSSYHSSELWGLNEKTSKLELFFKRKKDVLYNIEDGGSVYYMLTNEKAKNFKLVELPKDDFANLKKHKTVISHNINRYIESVDVFEKFIAVSAKQNALSELEIISRNSAERRKLKFPDAAYVIYSYANPEYKTDEYLFQYESLKQPESIYRYNLVSLKEELVKEKDVPNFDSSRYETQRIFIEARDKTKVPVTFLRLKGETKPLPLFLEAYGSYGISFDPEFSISPFSLVDRGFLYAIAHVRGGSDMGRSWYDNGRMMKKLNTFYDFIDSAEALKKLGYADSSSIFANGGSAGGLLMGGILNMRPDLFKAVIAEVPFVDVLTTMLDKSIPLTTAEFEEWGNPEKKKEYFYMKKYSPYDNVTAKAYPAIMVTTGLHDSQVQYWEPAKWVAKLRDFNQSKNPIIFRVEMGAGHSGATGRFKALKDRAEVLAFVLGVQNKIIEQ